MATATATSQVDDSFSEISIPMKTGEREQKEAERGDMDNGLGDNFLRLRRRRSLGHLLVGNDDAEQEEINNRMRRSKSPIDESQSSRADKQRSRRKMYSKSQSERSLTTSSSSKGRSKSRSNSRSKRRSESRSKCRDKSRSASPKEETSKPRKLSASSMFLKGRETAGESSPPQHHLRSRSSPVISGPGKSSSIHRSEHGKKSPRPMKSPNRSPRPSRVVLRNEIKKTLSLRSLAEVNDNKSPRLGPRSSRRLGVDDDTNHRLINDDTSQRLKELGESVTRELRASNHSTPALLNPKRSSSNSNVGTSAVSVRKNSIAEDDSIPELVDDSLQREEMEGTTGEKKWNIREDTPGGHAPEKLSIVPGVESHNDSLDEDDDILEEEDDIIRLSLDSDRANQKQMLPRDPIDRKPIAALSSVNHPGDRFSASFQNTDMWKVVEHAETKRNMNGHDSMQSDQAAIDFDAISELGSHVPDEHTVTISNHTFDTSVLEEDHSNPCKNATTPSTLKRRGARPVDDDVNELPALQGRNSESSIGQDQINSPSTVPEDAVADTIHQSMSGANPETIKVLSKSNPGTQKNESNSTGRRSSKQSSSNRRAGKRPSKGNGAQSVPTSIARSQMSPSSFLSTPTSMLSMGSAGPQKDALQALREQLPPSGASRNKSLHLHVGREPSRFVNEDDDYTLGASTISTNFTTTQRTFGDNTVSSRSLFRTEAMNCTDILKAPQRRRGEDSDDEERTEEPLNSNYEANDVLGQVSSISDAFGDVPEKPRSDRRNLIQLRKANSNRGVLKKKPSKRNLLRKAQSWKGNLDM